MSRNIWVACLLLGLFTFVTPGVAHAQTSFSSVNLGTVPRGVAVGSSTGYVYTLLYLNGTTLALDAQTLATAAKIATPSPYAVAVNPATGNVYVSQGQGASIAVINGTTNTLSTMINGTGTSYALAVDESDNLILGADPADSALWIVAGSTNAVLARVPIGATSALAVDPTLHEAFAGNLSSTGTGGAIEVVNTTSMTIARMVQIPITPGHFAVDPASHLLFVTSGNGGANGINFLAIDDRTFQTVYSLHLGDVPTQVAVASPDVFVSDVSTNRLYEVVGSNGSVLMNSTGDATSISFTGITSMAFDAKSGRLFITENDVTSLIVVSTGTTSASSNSSLYLVIVAPAVASAAAAFFGFLYLRGRRARGRQAPVVPGSRIQRRRMGGSPTSRTPTESG